MKSSGMCTLVTLRGRYLRLARSFCGSGARLRGPERGAGAMPARFSSNSSASGSCGICMAGQPHFVDLCLFPTSSTKHAVQLVHHGVITAHRAQAGRHACSSNEVQPVLSGTTRFWTCSRRQRTITSCHNAATSADTFMRGGCSRGYSTSSPVSALWMPQTFPCTAAKLLRPLPLHTPSGTLHACSNSVSMAFHLLLPT